MKRDKELDPVQEDEDVDVDDLDEEDLMDLDDYVVGGGARGFVAGVLVGVLIGAGGALLLAPDRGEVVRKRIGRGFREFQEDARDQVEDWRGDAQREVRRQKRKLKRRLGRSRRD